MNNKFRRGSTGLLLALSLTFGGCRQAAQVEGFDSARWKADPKGCKGERAAVWKAFAPNKENMLGYSENGLAALLGPPDNKNLLEKGQKAYSYYIFGAPGCGQEQRPQLLQVRVNVTGNVSELQLMYE